MKLNIKVNIKYYITDPDKPEKETDEQGYLAAKVAAGLSSEVTVGSFSVGGRSGRLEYL